MSFVRIFIVVVAAVLLVSSPAGAQSVERSVFVSVLNKDAKPVTGLGPEAFNVREDGQAREVLRVSKASTPIDLAILVDNSKAATDYIQDLRRALASFVSGRAAKGHQVALIGLADRPTVLVDYTSSAERLAQVAGRIFAQEGSGTLLLDGLIDVSRGIQRREAERRVILAITTEGTDFSNVGYERTLEALDESGAQFFALVITRGAGAANITSEEARNRNIVLDRGTQSTGGRRDHLLSSMALPDALGRLAAELDDQYHLIYARPDTTVPPKRVEVTVREPGLTARAVLAKPPRRPEPGK
jgi:VWFA-related protein